MSRHVSTILNQISWLLEKPADQVQDCMPFVCLNLTSEHCSLLHVKAPENKMNAFLWHKFQFSGTRVEVSEQVKQIKCLQMHVVMYELSIDTVT